MHRASTYYLCIYVCFRITKTDTGASEAQKHAETYTENVGWPKNVENRKAGALVAAKA